ncbi:hypothetical protein HanIR_Chr09g0430181 [Helianthus annuus]|nr:hypothetical protein HanIR_Chr09g0430181 [Helianthus annuus]
MLHFISFHFIQFHFYNTILPKYQNVYIYRGIIIYTHHVFPKIHRLRSHRLVQLFEPVNGSNQTEYTYTYSGIVVYPYTYKHNICICIDHRQYFG